ncbi:MAG TPA: AbrB/MazE/SpoVT family DNA-binding domain-containing protein [Candidatus Cloacimonetes bacterium]|nr:AbrB/MazE/SpoVT family DNA-binding domain-containing protein [Candidatus Cloacimonadota bacterium]
MKANLIAIGNSKGIRIPKIILEQCHIKNFVDLEVNDDLIMIRPFNENPRKNWDKEFKKMHKNSDDRLFIDGKIDINNQDWVW